MSKFFVGQRVRILYCNGWPELAGQAGVVVGMGLVGCGKHVGAQGWDVAPDSWGGALAPRRGIHGGMYLCALNDQLEPLIPPHEASQFTFRELMDRLKAGEGVPA